MGGVVVWGKRAYLADSWRSSVARRPPAAGRCLAAPRLCDFEWQGGMSRSDGCAVGWLIGLRVCACALLLCCIQSPGKAAGKPARFFALVFARFSDFGIDY